VRVVVVTFGSCYWFWLLEPGYFGLMQICIVLDERAS
jgi:hypothetical protein